MKKLMSKIKPKKESEPEPVLTPALQKLQQQQIKDPPVLPAPSQDTQNTYSSSDKSHGSESISSSLSRSQKRRLRKKKAQSMSSASGATSASPVSESSSSATESTTASSISVKSPRQVAKVVSSSTETSASSNTETSSSASSNAKHSETTSASSMTTTATDSSPGKPAVVSSSTESSATSASSKRSDIKVEVKTRGTSQTSTPNVDTPKAGVPSLKQSPVSASTKSSSDSDSDSENEALDRRVEKIAIDTEVSSKKATSQEVKKVTSSEAIKPNFVETEEKEEGEWIPVENKRKSKSRTASVRSSVVSPKSPRSKADAARTVQRLPRSKPEMQESRSKPGSPKKAESPRQKDSDISDTSSIKPKKKSKASSNSASMTETSSDSSKSAVKKSLKSDTTETTVPSKSNGSASSSMKEGQRRVLPRKEVESVDGKSEQSSNTAETTDSESGSDAPLEAANVGGKSNKIEAWRAQVANAPERTTSEEEEDVTLDEIVQKQQAQMIPPFQAQYAPSESSSFPLGALYRPSMQNPMQGQFYAPPMYPPYGMPPHMTQQQMQMGAMGQPMPYGYMFAPPNYSSPASSADELTPFDSVSNAPSVRMRPMMMPPNMMMQGMPMGYPPMMMPQYAPQAYQQPQLSKKKAPEWIEKEKPKIGGTGTLMEKVKKGRDAPKATHNLIQEINYDPKKRAVPVLNNRKSEYGQVPPQQFQQQQYMYPQYPYQGQQFQQRPPFQQYRPQ